jgi:hypothetical protein
MAGGGSSEIRELRAVCELLLSSMESQLKRIVELEGAVGWLKSRPGQMRVVGPVAGQLVAKSEVGGVKVSLSVHERVAEKGVVVGATVPPKRRR